MSGTPLHTPRLNSNNNNKPGLPNKNQVHQQPKGVDFATNRTQTSSPSTSSNVASTTPARSSKVPNATPGTALNPMQVIAWNRRLRNRVCLAPQKPPATPATAVTPAADTVAAVASSSS